MDRRRTERGFTLVELIIAAAAGTFILLAVGGLQIVALRDNQQDSSRNVKIEAIRNALDHVVEDLRYCQAPLALDAIGSQLAVGLPGVRLSATCPGTAAGTTYQLSGGQLVRTDGTGTTVLTSGLDTIKFTVQTTKVVDIQATSIPVAGNPIVVPVSVAARLSTLPDGSPTGGMTADSVANVTLGTSKPVCGAQQAAFTSTGFYSASPITTTNSTQSIFNGDVYATGGITQPAGTVVGVSATNTTTDSGGQMVLPNQPPPPVPTPDWSALTAAAQTESPAALYYHGGGWAAPGPFTANGVIWVGGNMTVGDPNGNGPNVSVTGKVTLAIYGDLTIYASFGPATTNDQLVLLVNGNVRIVNPASVVTALVLTSGTLSANSFTAITGVVVAKSVVMNSGPFAFTQNTSSLVGTLPGMQYVCSN